MRIVQQRQYHRQPMEPQDFSGLPTLPDPPPPADALRWQRYAGRDVLPLWVADMDFAAPPEVIAALQERIACGLFGYGAATEAQCATIVEHCRRAYDWAIDADWLIWLPGLVPGLHVACQTIGEAGDGVATVTPVYPPFLSAPVATRRRLLTLPLVHEANLWQWDFAAADALLRHARLLMLCHPHNPVGRAWREDELWQLALLAEKHDLIVCSDEIHADLTLYGRHRPFASLSPDIARRTITLMAPSKTYNLAGLSCAFAIVPDAELRQCFRRTMRGIVPEVNVLGLTACEAAYRLGGPWRERLLERLRGQAMKVEQTIAQLPCLSMSRVEASFLAWIDARGLGLEHPADFFEQAGLGLMDGAAFGPGQQYGQYVRLNFGTQPALLDLALDRLTQACQGRE